MPAAKKSIKSILALDGGGVRGIITAQWLAELERRLGKPVHNYVDLVAGTSTGSILACAVASGIPATKIVDLYKNRARHIFPKRSSWNIFGRAYDWTANTLSNGISHPKYEPNGLHAELKRVFKSTTTLGQMKIPVVVTSYDTLGRQAVVFKRDNPAHRNLKVWEVCTASSSAPTYFPAHVMKIGHGKVPLIDGGVVANNPTACAIAEAIRVRTDAKQDRAAVMQDLFVVSMGTGETTRPITIEESQEWGAIEWAIPVIDVLFDGAADAVNYIVKQTVGDENYVRLQVKLTKAYDELDNADETNLNALLNHASAYIQNEGAEKIQQVVDGLKQSRRAATTGKKRTAAAN